MVDAHRTGRDGMASQADVTAVERGASGPVGQTAWGAAIGHGSYLTVEFGDPLPPERSDGRPHGRWHLWVADAAWRIEGADLLVASEDVRNRLERAAEALNGRTLHRVRVVPPALETTFTFDGDDGGLDLRVFPVHGTGYEHWSLYRDDDTVLVVGPGDRFTVEPLRAPSPVGT